MAYLPIEFGPNSLLAPTYGVELDESGNCLANIRMTGAQRFTLSIDSTPYGVREIRAHSWMIGEERRARPLNG